MTWLVSRSGEHDDEVVADEAAAEARVKALVAAGVVEVVGWEDLESVGPWISDERASA